MRHNRNQNFPSYQKGLLLVTILFIFVFLFSIKSSIASEQQQLEAEWEKLEAAKEEVEREEERVEEEEKDLEQLEEQLDEASKEVLSEKKQLAKEKEDIQVELDDIYEERKELLNEKELLDTKEEELENIENSLNIEKNRLEFQEYEQQEKEKELSREEEKIKEEKEELDEERRGGWIGNDDLTGESSTVEIPEIWTWDEKKLVGGCSSAYPCLNGGTCPKTNTPDACICPKGFIGVDCSIPICNGCSVPDYVIIGAQKAGTTSLYTYLIGNKNVRPAAHKEIHFFDSKTEDHSINYYMRSFSPPINGTVTGEASPAYWYDNPTPRLLFSVLPRVKLIGLMRDPVDRFISGLYMNIRKHSPENAKSMLPEANKGIRVFRNCTGANDENPFPSVEEWNRCAGPLVHIKGVGKGLYYYQMLRWLQFFKPHQFMLIRSGLNKNNWFGSFKAPTKSAAGFNIVDLNFFANSQKVVDEVCRFIGVKSYQFKTVVRNQRPSGQEKQPDEIAARELLGRFFKPYNEALTNLLQENLGSLVQE